MGLARHLGGGLLALVLLLVLGPTPSASGQEMAVSGVVFYDDNDNGRRDAGEEPAPGVLRTQRTVFQLWKIDVPWARAGEVTLANGGEIAKKYGLFPIEALLPQAPLSAS